jgi:iron complex transport system ATP-binding protein
VKPVLEVSHVGVCYPGAQAPSLIDVSFAAAPSEVIGIVGPNGAGKSTLLRVCAGIIQPDEGDVRLDGASMETLRRRDIARRLAYVPQDVEPALPYPVDEVVLTGRHPHLGLLQLETQRDRQVADAAMRQMHVEPLAKRRMETLSGGERQRVFIARALAAEPSILLLDEPAAHLDLGYRVELGLQLKRLAEEKSVAVLVVHHDLNLASLTCSRLVLLGDGKLLSEGTPAEVLTTEQLESVYGWPVVVDQHPDTGVPRVTPRAR